MDIPFAVPVVRVLFEFARDRACIDVGQVLLCVAEHLRVRGQSTEGWAGAFRPTLRALERAELVEIFDDGRIRLTAGGFALAVATGASIPSAPRSSVAHSRRQVSSAHVRPRLVA